MIHSGGQPHTNVGDRGQRYEVRATGYPKPDQESVIGWVSTLAGAEQLAKTILLAPSCTGATVFDRVNDKTALTLHGSSL